MAHTKTIINEGLVVTEAGTLTPASVTIDPAGSPDTTTTIVSSQTVDQVLTLPDATDTLIGKDTTDVLTNKSMDGTQNTFTNIPDSALSPGINAAKIADGSVSNAEYQYLDGVTSSIQDQLDTKAPSDSPVLQNVTIQDPFDNTKQVVLNVSGVSSATTRTAYFPDATTELLGTDSAQPISNKVIDSSNLYQIKDGNLVLEDETDSTKKMLLQLSGISPFTVRTLSVPDADTTIVGTNAQQTLSVKTIGDALTFTQITTPSNPASGFNKIYVKSDNKFYTLDSSGTETEVGSGGGSSTPVNTQLMGTSIDWTLGDVFWKEISANETYTFANVVPAKTITVIIKNTGASSITLAFPTALTGGTLIVTVLSGRENAYTFVASNSKIYATVVADMI